MLPVAPWIIEAWTEALDRWVVQMPVLGLGAGETQALVLGSTAALLVLALLAVREMPPDARALARLLMAAVLLVPLADGVARNYGSEIEAGVARIVAAAQPTRGPGRRTVATAPDVVAAAEPEAREPAPPPPRPHILPDQAPVADAPPPHASEPPRVAVIEPVEPAPPAPQPPSLPVEVKAKPSAAESATTGIKRLSGLIARTVNRRGEGVTPVFYATDRAVDGAALPTRSGEPPRLDYSAERAGKLTFGRANVSMSRVGSTESGAQEVSEIKTLEHDEMLGAAVMQLSRARRNKDQALVFVHGFNTTFDTALYRAAGIAHEMKFDGAVFLYSWPSAGHVVRYAYDAESAGLAAPYLSSFLKMVTGETGAKSVTIVAHGLGAAPLLEALVAMKSELPGGVAINDVILAAPDLSRETFAARVRQLTGVAGRITLFAAASDRALNISRRYVGGMPRAGDVPEGGPMVLDGVETVDLTAVGTGAIGGLGSAQPAGSALVEGIAARVGGTDRARRPELESVATPKGAYWRYVKAGSQR